MGRFDDILDCQHQESRIAIMNIRQCGKITLAREFLQATSPGSLAMSTWRSKPQPLICN
jgi:hypothetical protein